MSTSLYQGLIRAHAGDVHGPEVPVGARHSRRFANNLHHAADSMGQHRVNWWPAKNFGGNNVAYIEPSSVDAAGQWYLLAPFGPWPLTLDHDGDAYRLVICMAVAIDSGSAQADFRCVIAPSYAASLSLRADSDYYASAATTSTTPAVSSLNTIDLGADIVSSWIRDVSTFDAVSGGSPATIQECPVYAWVWAKTANVGSKPRLLGLHVREYLAP